MHEQAGNMACLSYHLAAASAHLSDASTGNMACLMMAMALSPHLMTARSLYGAA